MRCPDSTGKRCCWSPEDLTSAQAARSLGINPTAFRVRLLRARRRLRAKLEGDNLADSTNHLDLETT
ncbi:MAG TPA: hypothetical protein VFK71_10330 [Gaiellaceae bacterium]|nr:hypothetical protein [Gaiellaceae bacterium]